ncbi:MAG: DUF6465 family protein [Eubacteriales bacterium]
MDNTTASSEETKKGTTKKTTAKKTTKKAALKESMVIEFSGKTYTQAELVKIAKDVWRYDLKNKVSDFKEVELYVKPEEAMVYYIINKKISGSFMI